ncbi:MAG: 6-bladed beta-propeller [Candidatus Aminicenantes bacterium]|nr:6-bladed beta-propeller [Candidatus Aminicenantes bacterium]
MKKEYLVYFLLILFFFMFALHSSAFISFSGTYSEQFTKNYIKLKIAGYFPAELPEERGIVFSQPCSLAIDKLKNIALLDSRQAKVFVFSESGDLISAFGKVGQGPGEFSFPTKVFFYEDNVCVFDQSAHNLQIFDLKGHFKKLIKLYPSYSDILINNQGQIFCARLLKFEQPYLIDLLDQNGERVLSFGQPLKLENIPLGLLNDLKLAFFNDYVLAASRTTGYINIYSKQGNLVKEIDALKIYLNKEVNDNINRFKNFDRTKPATYSHIFESIKTNENSIYFLRSRPGVYEILEMNELFKLENVYKIETKGILAIDFDIALTQERDKPKFYLIDYEEEKIRILILTPERRF